MDIVVTVEPDARTAEEAAVMKVSRIVDAINYGAAYDDESLYPVNEAVIAWYWALPAHWGRDALPRFAELKQLIERTPTEKGITLVVSEREPGLIEIKEAGTAI